MKIHRYAILTAIGIVILFAFLALFFFWVEETIPQDNSLTEDPMDQIVEESESQLYLTVMTHMEQSFFDDRDEDIFLEHVEQLRYAMDQADRVGAILSIESEKPFAEANFIWDIPILQEILDRGHGVQTHCDLGSKYTQEKMSGHKYAEAFAENKEIVDRLIGEENNLGCSGGAGINDWAVAASLAGFKYINGIVAGHLLAMDYENRPGEKWTDEYLSSDGWHMEFPENLEDRIYPLALADATDFMEDDNPVIIMLPGTIGRLDHALEGPDDLCVRTGSCEFTNEDIDAMLTTIQEVIDIYDPELGVAKMTVYVPASLYNEENNLLFNYFFEEIGKLRDENLIKFGTHKEIYEAFVEQEGLDI